MAGLIFFFLSVELRHDTKLGRQHCADLIGLSSIIESPLGVLSLLHTELAPETYGVPFTDGSTSSIVVLISVFPLAVFWLPWVFCSSTCWSSEPSLVLCRNSSASFGFFAVGDGSEMEPRVLSGREVLLT